MINTEKLMECNAVVNCLMEYKPEITKEEVIKTEIFVMNRYENGSLLKWEDIDLEKYYFDKPDIIDYYLRANIDEDVIEINEEELMEYLLERYFPNKSKNDLDFLSNDLYKELFIIEMAVFEDRIAKNVYFVDGKYYLYKDDYTLERELNNLYQNYYEAEDVPF